jgi:peptidoglycan/xylan/chitin deacetylase (PgdA/CDA1 family)
MNPMPTILTYHSQNILGEHAVVNDHEALAEDLETLHSAGFRFIGLGRLADWLDGRVDDSGIDRAICLTFDDGCDFDVRDMDWPGAGTQRSMLGILQDFIGRHGDGAQPGLHATSFVIASPEARRVIDRASLFGRGWMSDDWWGDAAGGGLLSLGNHGWDHNHPDLDTHTGPSGVFTTVDDWAQCENQVIRAARYIESRAGQWPEMFAYPFGESSTYIREEFFPGFVELHRCRAALGTEGGPVTRDSDRWNLPRLVCGRDWQSSSELLQAIRSA